MFKTVLLTILFTFAFCLLGYKLCSYIEDCRSKKKSFRLIMINNLRRL